MRRPRSGGSSSPPASRSGGRGRSSRRRARIDERRRSSPRTSGSSTRRRTRKAHRPRACRGSLTPWRRLRARGSGHRRRSLPSSSRSPSSARRRRAGTLAVRRRRGMSRRARAPSPARSRTDRRSVPHAVAAPARPKSRRTTRARWLIGTTAELRGWSSRRARRAGDVVAVARGHDGAQRGADRRLRDQAERRSEGDTERGAARRHEAEPLALRAEGAGERTALQREVHAVEAGEQIESDRSEHDGDAEGSAEQERARGDEPLGRVSLRALPDAGAQRDPEPRVQAQPSLHVGAELELTERGGLAGDGEPHEGTRLRGGVRCALGAPGWFVRSGVVRGRAGGPRGFGARSVARGVVLTCPGRRGGAGTRGRRPRAVRSARAPGRRRRTRALLPRRRGRAGARRLPPREPALARRAASSPGARCGRRAGRSRSRSSRTPSPSRDPRRTSS